MQIDKGILIAFEGIDCAGKSSIIKELVPRLSAECNCNVLSTGEKRSEIKDFLYSNNIRRYSPLIKTLLFAADRAFLYEDVLCPALNSGALVLWDRYVDTAIIYRKIELSNKETNITEKYVCDVNQPFRKADLTFVIDISVDTFISRAKKSNRGEPYNSEFLSKAREEYLLLSKKEDYILIDGECNIDDVVDAIALNIKSRYPHFFKTFSINMQTAIKVVEKLNSAYQQRTGILENINDLVENQIPEDVKPLSYEHSIFLFYIVCNDHGMKSSHLYEKAKQLFLEHRELFEPRYIVSNFDSGESEQLIELTGGKLGTRYPKQTSISWYNNSQKLLNEYSGDPRNLYNSSNDAKMLLKNILEFRSYGPKTGGMLLRALVGLNFSKVHNVEDVLLPVDIHDTRISYYTGIISFNNNCEFEGEKYYKYVKPVQQTLRNACKANGFNWLDVDRALWLIGSNGCVSKKCISCPLNDICSIGIVEARDKQIPFNV